MSTHSLNEKRQNQFAVVCNTHDSLGKNLFIVSFSCTPNLITCLNRKLQADLGKMFSLLILNSFPEGVIKKIISKCQISLHRLVVVVVVVVVV